MYIKGRMISFDNGVEISFDDTFDIVKSEVKNGEKLDIDDAYYYISFVSDKMIKDYREETTYYFTHDEDNKLYEIEMHFNTHAYAGKDFESYLEFADYNKKFFNELREYLLEQFGQEKVVGNSDHGFTIKDGNLVLGLNTGRGFEHVNINIFSEDYPLLED